MKKNIQPGDLVVCNAKLIKKRQLIKTGEIYKIKSVLYENDVLISFAIDYPDKDFSFECCLPKGCAHIEYNDWTFL
jgi:hypothetical protein